eukprot:CAMPEP_0184865370 /NCGR_PEP_ID=MMETSP0580-20130426/17863_1 /TAXON_ID=1118495 /ORGANISM="Dactyliosolen fragilissimus" /LENGTH=395 /DNA_ID=CAMNT_0027364539 /DNA_START=136 /DNA_END=1324 /DNA_ORIENTATION=-
MNLLQLNNKDVDVSSRKRRKMLNANSPILLIPYFIGLLWTASHPFVSIITGESKCRGTYIDEAQLEPHQYYTQSYQYDNTLKPEILRGGDPNSWLCRSLFLLRSKDRGASSINSSDKAGYIGGIHSSAVTCYAHNGMDVVRILPSHYRPTESIVIILPFLNEHNYDKDIQVSTIRMIDRLAKERWLAKVLYLVAPYSSHSSSAIPISIQDTVQHFLTSYGVINDFDSPHFGDQIKAMLPLDFRSQLIRQLLVLDIQMKNDVELPTKSYVNRINFLTGGRRGSLPNLDLVTHALASYKFRHEREVKMHRFDMSWWKQHFSDKFLPNETFWKRWGEEIGDMLAFMADLATLPHAPHSPALDAGIDSFTMQVFYNAKSSKEKSSRLLLDEIFYGKNIA